MEEYSLSSNLLTMRTTESVYAEADTDSSYIGISLTVTIPETEPKTDDIGVVLKGGHTDYCEITALSAGSLDAASESSDSAGETSTSESSGSNSAESSVISGTPVPCTEHTLSYHSIPSTLTQLVDADEYYEWSEALFAESDTYNRSGEEFTVIAFVQHFNISREDFTAATRDWMTDEKMQNLGTTQEEYLAEYGYTDQQIDAIYSGDQAQINAAFCGDMAYYSETDGQLYSIYWLSDHTAEDYAAAGLPEAEVTRILDAAESAGGQYAALAETATVQAQVYADIAEK